MKDPPIDLLLCPLVPGWICLQYGYLQTSKLNSTPPIFGSGPGALEENCKHPRQPQGGRLPQSIWEERPQLDSEESTTEGSRSSCCPQAFLAAMLSGARNFL